MQDLDPFATRVAKRFDQRHPVLSGLVGSLFFASVGLVSVLFAAHLVRTEASGLLVAAMIVGTAVGAVGAAIWAYAFAHEFDVPIWVGRLLFVLTLAAGLGAIGAVMGNPLVQAISVAVLASRFLPQAFFALLQVREDVRHPEKRAERVLRAMTMASWSRPK
jgi:MFS family permease